MLEPSIQVGLCGDHLITIRWMLAEVEDFDGAIQEVKKRKADRLAADGWLCKATGRDIFLLCKRLPQL